MLKARSEFTVPGAYQYTDKSARGWILSHLMRYRYLMVGFMALGLIANICAAFISTLTGIVFTVVTHVQSGLLGWIALALLALALVQGASELSAHFLSELLGQRFIRDARAEHSLANKNQHALSK